MQRTRIQRGGVNLDVSSSGKQVWVFRWRETRPDGRRAPRKRVIGTLEEYPTKKSAENAARGFRLNLVDQGAAPPVQITMKELVDHFSEHEQVDKGEEGRAYSTRDRCESVLNCWILPRWEKQRSIRFERSQSRIGCVQFPGPRVRGRKSGIL